MNIAPTVLVAGGSHLYPGAQGSLRGEATGSACVVEFADGSAAFGELVGGEATILELGPYTTARGTGIPPKRWKVAFADGRFRILSKL